MAAVGMRVAVRTRCWRGRLQRVETEGRQDKAMRHVRPDWNPCRVPCQTSRRSASPRLVGISGLVLMPMPDQQLLPGLFVVRVSRWSSAPVQTRALLPRAVRGAGCGVKAAGCLPTHWTDGRVRRFCLAKLITVTVSNVQMARYQDEGVGRQVGIQQHARSMERMAGTWHQRRRGLQLHLRGSSALERPTTSKLPAPSGRPGACPTASVTKSPVDRSIRW